MSAYGRMLGRELPCNLLDLLGIRPLPLPGAKHEQLCAQVESGCDFPDVLYRLGLSHLGRQELGLARQRLDEAVAAKPQFLQARLALAAACDLLAQHAAAAKQVENVLADMPASAQEAAFSPVNESAAPRYTLLCAAGFSFERIGEWQLAAERYREALTHNPSDMFARHRLAAICLSHNLVAEAIEHHQAILEQLPQQQAIRVSLAHLLQMAGRHQEAVWEYEKALCLEPDSWELESELADELNAAGNSDEAIAHLENLVERQTQFPDLRLRLANLYSNRGDDANAMEQYGRALSLHPEYLDGHVAVARHELGMGRTQAAIAHYQRAIEINDQNVEAYAGLAVAQQRLNQAAEAQETLASAAKIAGNSNVLLVQLGMLELKSQAAELAERAFDPDAVAGVADPSHSAADCETQRRWIEQQAERYEQMLDQHPTWTDVRVRHGMLLKLLGKFDEACGQFERAANENPGYAEAWMQLGLTRQDTGDVPGAIAALETAVQLRSDWADLHYRLGLAYCSQLEFDMAMEQLETATAQNRQNTDFQRQLWVALDGLQMTGRSAAKPTDDMAERTVPLAEAE